MRNFNILIIDDHSSTDFNFSKLFSNYNYKVYSADGIENGIEISKRYVPDVMISFLTTEENGRILVSKLSSHPNTKYVPIIYLSCNNNKTHFREIMNLGADDYFFNNFESEELLESVNKRISKSSEMKSHFLQIYQQTLVVESYQKKDHILITVGKKLQLIKFDRIICITAEKEYSKIRIKNGKSIIVRKSLKSWLELLPDEDFLRIHRQSIININAIERIEKLKSTSYIVYLKSLTKPLALSRRYAILMKKTFSVSNNNSIIY